MDQAHKDRLKELEEKAKSDTGVTTPEKIELDGLRDYARTMERSEQQSAQQQPASEQKAASEPAN